MQKAVPQIDPESFKLLIENVEDYAIILLDPGGIIISWNKGAQQIKGSFAKFFLNVLFCAKIGHKPV